MLPCFGTFCIQSHSTGRSYGLELCIEAILEHLKLDESWKEHRAGEVELVACRIVHGQSLHEIVVLSKG